MDIFDIEVVSGGADAAEATQHAEDLAWEAATHVSQQFGWDVGSDDFVNAYKALRERYENCAQCFGFLHKGAAQALEMLLEAGMAVTVGRDADEAEMTGRFHVMIGIILSYMTWCYTTGPEGWIDNKDWIELDEEYRSTRFMVVKPDLDIRKENNDND